MRVALIGPVPPVLGGAVPGGVATHQAHLAAGLNAAGLDAPLLATNTAADLEDWRAPSATAPFPLYRVGSAPLRWRDLIALGPARVVRYAADLALHGRRFGSRATVLHGLLWYHRFLAAVRPTVIHVQHPLERALYVRTVQRLEGWRIPVVITAHSLFGEHDDATIQTLMRPNLLAADRVICVSPHIAEQACELGVAPDRVRVIRSGVETEVFRPRDRQAARLALGLSSQSPVVLFVGNLEPRKQVDVLLRAFVTVRERVPGSVLVIVGTGESAGVADQSRRLVRLAQELRLMDNDSGAPPVKFVGRVSDEALQQYYAAADVFALPSSAEAQGIVALEAMACGLVVVASAVGGLLGTVEDGRTGYLVPSGDVAALANRVASVLLDGDRRQVIGSAARAAVEQSFSWSQAIAATIRVYQELCDVPMTPIVTST